MLAQQAPDRRGERSLRAVGVGGPGGRWRLQDRQLRGGVLPGEHHQVTDLPELGLTLLWLADRLERVAQGSHLPPTVGYPGRPNRGLRVQIQGQGREPLRHERPRRRVQ